MTNRAISLDKLQLARFGKSLLRFPLALCAIVAGIVVGRFYSGLWLARSIVGIKRDTRLPRKIERELRKMLTEWHNSNGYSLYHETSNGGVVYDCHHDFGFPGKKPREKQYVRQGEFALCVTFPTGTDAYTTVGTILVRAEYYAQSPSELMQETEFEYFDVYNWLPKGQWGFSVSIFGLPFDLDITGKDSLFPVGSEFLTTGSITIAQ
jgi:hypothetical protein